MTIGQKFQLWRHTCGYTQYQAAEALAYSPETICAIERHVLPLSGKIARCATAISGVSFKSLQEATGSLVTTTGEPFTNTTFAAWQEVHSK
jgi:DNA-binding XRE family transcriptional regulator